LIDIETLQRAVDLYRANGNSERAAARASGLARSTFQGHLKAAATRGMLLDHPAAMPGFRISQTTEQQDADGNVKQRSIQQKPELGSPRPLPEGHLLKGVSRLENGDGEILLEWKKTDRDAEQRIAAMQAVVEGFKVEIPRAEPVIATGTTLADKCNQYTVTDYHFGMMAWGEETGGADSDLKLQERLWCAWWSWAIENAPPADTAIFAQLGDLVHFDSLKAITPAHGHILDSDSRFSKVVRTVIRCLRFAVRELLKKHRNVHLIFSDANHDEAGEVWMREMFAAHFEDEPRITVDRSPGSFNVFEWGLTSLFYHHGHKKKFKDVDTTWVGRFREVFGRTKFSYGHTGHLHSDEIFTSNTGVKVERHETLAAPSAYEANAGYNSGRSAKVITYSKQFGEVGRLTITPEMVISA
jgi:hypothetical protein